MSLRSHRWGGLGVRAVALLALAGLLPGSVGVTAPDRAALLGIGGTSRLASPGTVRAVAAEALRPAAAERGIRPEAVSEPPAEPERAIRQVPPNPRDSRLQAGAEGVAVLALQERLDELHYDIGPLDGIFGYSTHHGVVAFQKINGLPLNGIVGPKVWEALDHPVVPKPRHSLNGSYLEVDLTEQVLYHVMNGKVARILDASTGGGYWFEVDGEMRYAATTMGGWRIFRQIDGWSDSQVGSMYKVNYFVYRTALHGYPDVPPYPASHGCVRITLQAMDRLWPKLHMGMQVFVYRS